MKKSDVKIGMQVRDKDGAWMRIIKIDRDSAICEYSDGYGIIVGSRKISDLKEEKE